MHLLVVEDDTRLSRLLRRLLTQDRHVVEVATTADEGLEIATSGTELDAVVLDVGLPDRSGFEVARQLRREGRLVPILMLTARDSVSDRVEGSMPARTTTWSNRSPTRSCWPGFARWAGVRPHGTQIG